MHSSSLTSAPHTDTEVQRQDALSWISRGVLPLKFAYAGSSAAAHTAFASTEHYRQVANPDGPHHALFWKLARSAVHLIDYGCDTGLQLENIFDGRDTDAPTFRNILLIDYSRELGNQARIRLSDKANTLLFEQLDFESEQSSIANNLSASGPTLALLLGNTLSNVESPAHFLSQIRASLATGTNLMLTFVGRSYGAASSEEEMLQPYLDSAFVPSLLSAFEAVGFSPQSLTIDLRFDWQESAVMAFADMTNAEMVGNFPYSGPASVRCFLSRRFRAGAVEALLHAAGFKLLDRADSPSLRQTVLAAVA